MKIIIVTSFPFPDGKATSNRIKVFAEEISKKNKVNSVEIVAPSNKKNGIISLSPKINIINLYVPSVNKSNFLLRAISEIKMAFNLWPYATRSNKNIIIVSIPSVLLLLPLLIQKKRNFLILDVRDAVWSYFSKGLIKSLTGWLLRHIFKFALTKADLVTVTNSYEFHNVKNFFGVEPLLVKNGISKSKMLELQSIKSKFPTAKINVSYIGNVGLAQELDVLIDFSKKYKSNIETNIIGDGIKLNYLRNRCLTEKIDNVNFYGHVSPENVNIYLEKSDILFAQIAENFKSAIPTKVFEYIASGRKVLLGLPEGAAKNTFQKFYGIEIFPPGNLENMVKSYENLIDKEFSEKDKKYNIQLLLTEHIRENSIVSLLEALNKLE
jgi:glycosyltransferase involved in cell wall biosynthesis